MVTSTQGHPTQEKDLAQHEEPKEFNQAMYIAMRNRIFELEAKTVNYTPFNKSKKRPAADPSDIMGDYGSRYEREPGHGRMSKRHIQQTPPAYYRQEDTQRRHHPPEVVYRYSTSYPSWYSPESYASMAHVAQASLHQRAPGGGMPEQNVYPGKHARGQSYFEQELRPRAPPPSGPVSSQLMPTPPDCTPQGRDANTISQSTPAAPQVPRPIQPRLSVDENQLPSASLHNIAGTSSSRPINMQDVRGSQQQLSPNQNTHPSNTTMPNGSATAAAAAAAAEQKRQSFQQRQHRAQQQAQSDYSRSYHLQKHMQMLDQQRAAQLAQQKLEQEKKQHRNQSDAALLQTQRVIQRHYQPHQRMYPHPSHTIIQAQMNHSSHGRKPFQPLVLPSSTVSTTASSTASTTTTATAASRSIRLQQHQQLAKQQLIQRYQLQKQLQEKQHLQQQQMLQLQHLRQRQLNRNPGSGTTNSKNNMSNAITSRDNRGGAASGLDVHVIVPSKTKKSRPLECSNCMYLEGLRWYPEEDIGQKTQQQQQQESHQGSNNDSNSNSNNSNNNNSNNNNTRSLLCAACVQFHQVHGRPRPVASFRTNFLKKIHCRFKQELQEIRFQGWQDAQVIEIEDHMTESDYQAVFEDLVKSTTTPFTAVTRTTRTGSFTPPERLSPLDETDKTDRTVIKIEDDDDDVCMLPGPPTSSSSAPAPAPVKEDSSKISNFNDEAAVGELFGHRWRTEPMVGYTLVHFGGSDRTRMVPMNPTVPSLTFNRLTETVSFSFRVLVNGLCLLSSGGGPPALHMPEMADDEDSEQELEHSSSTTSRTTVPPEGQ
ncbi:hypothetical protein BG004_006814 [Podila humilis]|nr:hypothetical protein BG004_006814 [Podila humilis]